MLFAKLLIKININILYFPKSNKSNYVNCIFKNAKNNVTISIILDKQNLDNKKEWFNCIIKFKKQILV